MSESMHHSGWFTRFRSFLGGERPNERSRPSKAESDEKQQSESLDFIFDRVSNSVELQQGSGDALDGKSIQVFAAASVVMAVAPLAGADQAWLIAIGIAFLACCWFAIQGMRPRSWSIARRGGTLWDEYWDMPVREIKLAIIDDISSSYRSNEDILKKKSRSAKWALVFLGLEAVAVTAAIVVGSPTSLAQTTAIASVQDQPAQTSPSDAGASVWVSACPPFLTPQVTCSPDVS